MWVFRDLARSDFFLLLLTMMRDVVYDWYLCTTGIFVALTSSILARDWVVSFQGAVVVLLSYVGGAHYYCNDIIIPNMPCCPEEVASGLWGAWSPRHQAWRSERFGSAIDSCRRLRCGYLGCSSTSGATLGLICSELDSGQQFPNGLVFGRQSDKRLIDLFNFLQLDLLSSHSDPV